MEVPPIERSAEARPWRPCRSEDRRYHRSMRRALRSAGAVLLIAAAFAIGWCGLPSTRSVPVLLAGSCR